VVVALSGGLDSVALLHLLRHTPELPALRLVAAHLDHRMRRGSGADAHWVVGLARAWSVDVRGRVVDTPPVSEDEARSLRYAFLEEVRADEGARWVVTAHHADDQVETVLFRVARGTGLEGLRGIPEVRAPGLWRPLLPFWRSEILAYARGAGLRWREDPTNVTALHARNVLRHRVVPLLEREVSAGARRGVLRLAQLAREDEEAWESLLPSLLAALDVERDAVAISFRRDALLEHHEAVRARLLRALARQVGARLDSAGTRIAVEFTSAGESGRAVRVTGALELRRDLHRITMGAVEAPAAADHPVRITGGAGHGEAVLGGSRYAVRWSARPVPGEWTECFDAGGVEHPLTLRAWSPGDRIRLSYGSKKLKKLFQESRVPRWQRDRTPVLVDARERVLWVPGIARSELAKPPGSNRELKIGVTHANSD
jgi:tRNA(Ile)-lysidine synthase